MSEIRELLADMREQRWQADARLAGITEEQMYLPTAFTLETIMTNQAGEIRDIEVRWMFLRRADHMEEHAIQLDGYLRNQFNIPRSQAHLYWAANQQARGDLYAALCGLTDDDLDVSPVTPEGEWSLRQILEHLIAVERSYTTRAVHAVERFNAGEPYGDHPPHLKDAPREWPGASLADLIAMLDHGRDDSLSKLIGLTDEELRAPSIWRVLDIDVRFHLMRYAQHEREHAAQIRKWRRQCGKPYTEAARLLGLAWQANGRLEGILAGVPDDILDRDPGNGDWPARRVLAHIASAEDYFRRMAEGALH